MYYYRGTELKHVIVGLLEKNAVCNCKIYDVVLRPLPKLVISFSILHFHLHCCALDGGGYENKKSLETLHFASSRRRQVVCVSHPV